MEKIEQTVIDGKLHDSLSITDGEGKTVIIGGNTLRDFLDSQLSPRQTALNFLRRVMLGTAVADRQSLEAAQMILTAEPF